MAAWLMAFAITALGTSLLYVLHRERSSRALLDEVIDSIAGGFVLWDARDKLVTCNQAFRDTYPLCAELLVPGTTFEEIIRYGVSQGQYPQAEGHEAEFVKEMVVAHQSGSQTAERYLRGGQWLLIHEQRTRSGNIIAIRSDITAFKRALAEAAAARDVVEHMAHHDMLTGLPNRVLFRKRLDERIADVTDCGLELAVLYLDLDRFKQVNDELGHGGGDELLAAVAGRLRLELGETDTAARLGGDEFAILMTGQDLRARAQELAERIIQTVAAPYSLALGKCRIGVSIGGALCDRPHASPDDIVQRADGALYEAKRDGRGIARFDTDRSALASAA